MTETKKRPKKFILRRLLVAALVLALAFALAMGANAASGGKLFEGFVTYTLFGDDGTAYEVTLNSEALEQAGDGTIIYSFSEQEGEKTLMAYQDSEGSFHLEEVELPKDVVPNTDEDGNIVEKHVMARPATESEAAAAQESDDIVPIHNGKEMTTAKRIS